MMPLRSTLCALVTLAGFYLPLAPGSAQVFSPLTIQPGAVWRDQQGEMIQAHGGGVIKVGGSYFWFGEDHTAQSSDPSFLNIKCYESKDLVHWSFRADALTRQSNGDLGPERVVERPKVIYNDKTHVFVMYAHIDGRDYKEAKVGVATCDRVDGAYAYKGSFQPLGHQSRDMTLFREEDGTAYLVFEDRQSGVRIAQLSSDYLSVEKEVALIPHAYEAPAMVKVDGVYYLLGSHLSGWTPNANEYTTADSPAGPWSPFQPVAPPETKTYHSQTAYILPVTGSRETSCLYLGDRWQKRDLKSSSYVWLPLLINTHRRTMALTVDAPWTLDAAAGTCSLPVSTVTQPAPPVLRGHP